MERPAAASTSEWGLAALYQLAAEVLFIFLLMHGIKSDRESSHEELVLYHKKEYNREPEYIACGIC